MIRRAMFKTDRFCFKIGDAFEFLPGVNLIVGEQGCGKSTLLRSLAVDHAKYLIIEADDCEFKYRDFEKDNLRVQPSIDHARGSGLDVLNSNFMSHGESVRESLRYLNAVPAGTILFLDEPDGALSIRSCMDLASKLRAAGERGVQVITSVHSQTVIEQFDEVLSLEHRRRMPSCEFVRLHKAPVKKKRSKK